MQAVPGRRTKVVPPPTSPCQHGIVSRRWLPLVFLLTLGLAGGGCGDADDDGSWPLDGDLLDQLRGLGEVVAVTESTTDLPGGYRYFELQFDQPVDHDHPEGPHFQQYATLIHRDPAAPMVLVHTGYGNWYADRPTQLTWLLQANQLVVEHRFFRGSRPTGAAADWRTLTIRQAAADHHRITVALRRLYPGRWLETGASKGGMTAIYHRRFYPDDVDGTVAYVAPISFGAPDYRYEPHVEAIGPSACRDAVRALQAELLRNRRAMLESRATSQASTEGLGYTRVAVPAAVESAVVSLEWSFWQYVGASGCPDVPAVTATDDAVWRFLEQVSPVSSSSDDDIAEFDAYYYQAEAELGYPGTVDQHLDGLTRFGDDAYAGAYPTGVEVPTWTVDPMTDVDAWVKASGERLLFLYGEWDPWTGGRFDLGAARDAAALVAPEAPHGADLTDLPEADRALAYGKLEAWSGVAPRPELLFRARPVAPVREPRVPPAIVRGLQLRARR